MRSLLATLIMILSAIGLSCDGPSEVVPKPAIDPDLIFLSRSDKTNWEWELYSMKDITSQPAQVLDLPLYPLLTPVLSHSGKYLLIVHQEGDEFQLYSVQLDGTDLTFIDSSFGLCPRPKWSFDDSQIVYERNKNNGFLDCDIVLLTVANGNKSIIVHGGFITGPTFSPPNKIAFSQNSNGIDNINTMELDSTDLRLLSEGTNPEWSPNGKQITYQVYTNHSAYQIGLVNSDGSNRTTLTNTILANSPPYSDYGNDTPHWTPDGSQIVYLSKTDHGGPEIYIMNVDGTNQKRLTNSGRSEDVFLTKDGLHILYASMPSSGNRMHIFTMDTAGGNQTQITHGESDNITPVWTK